MVIETAVFATLCATLATALYLWSVVLNSLRRGSYQESAEVLTNISRRPCRLSAELAQHAGARAGSRTLNLGIKRRLTFLARKRQDVSGRATRIRRYDAFASQSVLECHTASRVSCQRDPPKPTEADGLLIERGGSDDQGGGECHGARWKPWASASAAVQKYVGVPRRSGSWVEYFNRW